ncbi:hypothetical protein U737_08870 [Methylomonas sp. LW13]|nr:hypothetical protein CWO84_06700 [Methylomonas sp. Kb3]QBC27011.1 hypothetical protein U737_08870 [Methylomonas sp. LW13]
MGSIGGAGGIGVSGSARAVEEQSRQNEKRVIICFKMYSFMMLLRLQTALFEPNAKVRRDFSNGI